MSHRYGSRGLPTRIIAQEFDLLRNELKSTRESDLAFELKDETEQRVFKVDDILSYCYLLDENEIPARYRLQHLEKILENYNDKVIFLSFLSSTTKIIFPLKNSTVISKDPIHAERWSKIETKLGNILRLAADGCFSKNLINTIQRERYFVSGFLMD